MKQFSKYMEAIEINSGIRRVELALSVLFKIANFVKDGKTLNPEEAKGLERQLSYVRDNCLKAAGYFQLTGYTGVAIQNDLAGVINDSIDLLSKILSDYNDGVDNVVMAGKSCIDIAASLSDAARKV